MRPTALLALCLAGPLLAPGLVAAQDAGVPARLSLADAIRLVEARHPALTAVQGQIAAADAAVAAARERPNPTVSWLSEGYRPWAAGARSPGDQEMSVEVAQEFDTSGRRRRQAEAAALELSAVRASAHDELRQLRLDAQVAYFQLALARSEAGTTARALAEVDQVIAVNRERYRLGEVSGGELKRLEVERMRFTDDLLSAGLAEKDARVGLLSMLGADRLDAPLEPTDGLAVSDSGDALRQAGAGLDPAALAARALAARPDLAAARRDEERAGAELRLQRALRTPNMTVGAGYRRDFGVGGLVLSASVPLPILSRNGAGIARAEAGRRTAAGRTRLAERMVALEVQQAINAIETARARIASIESDYLQNAQAARDSALAAYRAGATDLIDYLDAQRAYRDVQRAYQRALFEHRVGLLRLDAAVGGAPGVPLP